MGWSLRNRPKCRGLGEISAFGTGSRLEINIFVQFSLFKLNIDNTNNINNINSINNINNINTVNINDIDDINGIGLEPQKPSQMQRSL